MPGLLCGRTRDPRPDGKTLQTHCRDGFQFLGFTLRYQQKRCICYGNAAQSAPGSDGTSATTASMPRGPTDGNRRGSMLLTG